MTAATTTLFLAPLALQLGLSVERTNLRRAPLTARVRIMNLVENVLIGSMMLESPLNRHFAPIHLSIGIIAPEVLQRALASVEIHHAGSRQPAPMGMQLAETVVALVCALVNQSVVRNSLNGRIDMRSAYSLVTLCLECLGHEVIEECHVDVVLRHMHV